MLLKMSVDPSTILASLPKGVRGRSTFLELALGVRRSLLNLSVEAAVPAAIKRVRRRHACRYSDGA